MAPNPDTLLIDEQFPELNERFYRGPSTPHWYLTQRYLSLLLLTRGPELKQSDAPVTFEVGPLKATFATEDSDEDTRDDFLSVESTVLAHHAAETLLRLYLAHEGLPRCPWLEVARLRQRGSFTGRVKDLGQRLQHQAITSSVMEVFTGLAGPSVVAREVWATVEWLVGRRRRPRNARRATRGHRPFAGTGRGTDVWARGWSLREAILAARLLLADE